MADSDNPKPPSAPGEISVEKRMLLAFALVGVVLILSQYLFSPAAPTKSGPVAQKQATPQQASKAPEPAAAAQPPADAAAVPQAVAQAEQMQTIDTKVYKIVFSNRGAVVRSWELKDYKSQEGKPVDLVNQGAAAKTHYPFSYLFENQKPSTDLNQALWVATPSPDGQGITFDYSNGRTVARKSLRFTRDGYLFELVSDVKENGAGIPHMLAWRGGFGDRSAYAAASTIRTIYFDQGENKLVENEAKVAKDGPATVGGTYSFAGVGDTYFLGVFLPRESRSIKLQTWSDSVAVVPNAAEEQVAGVGVGGDARNEFSVFVGPKDIDLLNRVNPRLAGAVDFGWFAFLARPIFLALNWLNDNYVRNFGWSIVILTIIINMLLLPLKISGMKSMKKMSSLQPEIQAINERYRDIGMRDPRKAEQNAEIMALYKKHGVNPLGSGCMPLLLQIPFFFAFYKVLSVAIELRGADWLWIRDLSFYDPFYVLPVIMVVTQFVLQKMTPATSADPAQQKMMLFMPLVFGFLFFKASAGLVLYWLTGNVVSLIQQWFINRMGPAPSAATAVVNAPKAPVRKSGRK